METSIPGVEGNIVKQIKMHVVKHVDRHYMWKYIYFYFYIMFTLLNCINFLKTYLHERI